MTDTPVIQNIFLKTNNKIFFIIASIYATWDDGRRPAISGGPLNEVYNFFMLTFRWGPTNIEGSEHTINNTRYAMEAQAVHVKADINFDTVSKAAAACGLVIISYFYEVSF